MLMQEFRNGATFALIFACALSIGTPAAAEAARSASNGSTGAAMLPKLHEAKVVPQHPAEAAQAGLSPQDKNFLIGAAKDAMLQLDLDKIAESRGKSPQIRRLAAEGVQTFEKAKGRLWTIAQEFSVTLPQSAPDEVVKMGNALSSATRADIDRQFVDQILPANSLAMNLFNSEAHDAKNPVLLQFAREMLPRLQQQQRTLLGLAREFNWRGQDYAHR